MGEVGILNVGAGDTKIMCSDRDSEIEKIRFKRIVTDMLRRGYALLVEIAPGKYRRAYAFDEATMEYVIADYDPLSVKLDEGVPIEPAAAPPEDSGEPEAGKAGRKVKPRRDLRIPASRGKATAVARTAGG